MKNVARWVLLPFASLAAGIVAGGAVGSLSPFLSKAILTPISFFVGGWAMAWAAFCIAPGKKKGVRNCFLAFLLVFAVIHFFGSPSISDAIETIIMAVGFWVYSIVFRKKLIPAE